MVKKKKSDKQPPRKVFSPILRTPKATGHGELVNDLVHVFVDDQNLFWGIVNEYYGLNFRIDFGNLLMVSARRSNGSGRDVSTAYIAGVIPDDDSFWGTAESQGFRVFRGFLGQGKRSKQDDAFLIAEMVSTIYEQPGPSTIVLVAGDADYGPALKKVVEKGWRVEVVHEVSSTGVSSALEPYCHEFRSVKASDFQRERQNALTSPLHPIWLQRALRQVQNQKCYFSTDISETLSCCKDGNFDYYGFAENICAYYPCDKYKQIVADIEAKRESK